MSLASVRIALRHVRRLATAPSLGTAGDGELLHRFADRSDQAAFEELVRRHGALVFGAARRLLRHPQDAEDVFQATFLTLARKARSIRKPGSVAAWLHGVACCLALRVRAASARRRAHEDRAAAQSEAKSPADIGLREAQAILDEELARLPEALRAPLVLCYLEGATRDEAARQLGWSLATLKRRLERGRAGLRWRLERRGVALPAALLAVGLTRQTGTAALAAGPIARAVTAFTTGRTAAVTGASSRAVALANELAWGAVVSRAKAVAALVLAAGLVCGAGVAAGLRSSLATPPAEEPGRAEAPKPPPANDPAGPEKTAKPGFDRYGDPLPKGAVARLGTVRFRHGYNINSVAFSPAGKAVATGSLDYALRLWETATGKELGSFPSGEMAQIFCVAFSPDGKTVALGNQRSQVRLFDRETGQQVHELQGRDGPVHSVAFSPNGKMIASAGSDKTVRLWEVATGNEVRKLEGHKEPVFSVAFSPDGKLLASGSADKAIRLWDLATGNEVRRLDGSLKTVLGLAFSPDGKLLASAAGDKAVRLWDVAGGKEIRRLEAADEWQRAVAFSPDGKWLVVASGDYGATTYVTEKGWVTLWDVGTGKKLRQFSDDRLVFEAVAFAPDGKTVAAAGGHDAVLHLWDAATGKELHQTGHRNAVSSVAFTADGRTVLTSSWDRDIHLWDAATGAERSHREGWAPWLSRDGKTLIAVTGWPELTVHVHDLVAGKERRRFPLDPEDRTFAVSSDGTLLAAAGKDGPIRVWDVATGKEVRQLEGHSQMVFHLDFLADGKTLVSTSADQTARLWDVATGKELRQFAGPCQVHAFSPDGRLRAVLGDGSEVPQSVRVLDAVTGKEIRRLPSKEGLYPNYLHFSPDGRNLVVGHYAGTGQVVLWEVATGREWRSFTGHRGPVWAAAFSPDGRFLATGSSDTTALVWDLAGGLIPKEPPPSEALATLWTDLAAADPDRARQAVWTLAAHPNQAVPFIKGRLRPVPRAEAARVVRLIADLDSDDFETRERAAKGLEELGEAAGPALRKALEDKPSVEVRRQVEQLLEKLDSTALSGDVLRALRAVEALELAGTAEARRALEALASGAPGARLTEDAKATLERLGRR
jgi:RNA polymerase sigma factor (sigma-70 family)